MKPEKNSEQQHIHVHEHHYHGTVYITNGDHNKVDSNINSRNKMSVTEPAEGRQLSQKTDKFAKIWQALRSFFAALPIIKYFF